MRAMAIRVVNNVIQVHIPLVVSLASCVDIMSITMHMHSLHVRLVQKWVEVLLLAMPVQRVWPVFQAKKLQEMELV